MVCKCSLVERLDLLPIAVLLMIGGKLPAQRAKSAHFVGHLPGAQSALSSPFAGRHAWAREVDGGALPGADHGTTSRHGPLPSARHAAERPVPVEDDPVGRCVPFP